jgi:two-component system chemotaxis response regulator CheY
MAVSMTMPILVVDDYNTMLRILRHLLRQLGFTNIDEANDGATALNKLRAKPYSLVISDWKPMTGGELLERLRADERLKDTPFVMVTNESGEEREGASTYLMKPFNAQALKQKLVSILGDF